MGQAVKTMEMALPSDPRMVQHVRQRVVEFIREARLDAQTLDDIKIAVSEACTNAILHGSPQGPSNQFRVRCEMSRDLLTIEVADQGRRGWEYRRPQAPADDYDPSGRGMLLMNHFCDQFEISTDGDGTRVRLVKSLAPAAAAPMLA